MTIVETVARTMLHEMHVGRYRGSDHPLHRQLASMTEDQVWQAVGGETRQSFVTMATVALRVIKQRESGQ